jgi:hypothetical protein
MNADFAERLWQKFYDPLRFLGGGELDGFVATLEVTKVALFRNRQPSNNSGVIGRLDKIGHWQNDLLLLKSKQRTTGPRGDFRGSSAIFASVQTSIQEANGTKSSENPSRGASSFAVKREGNPI